MGMLLHKSLCLFSSAHVVLSLGLDPRSTGQSSLVLILLQFCDEAARHCCRSSITRLSGFKPLGKLFSHSALVPFIVK